MAYQEMYEGKINSPYTELAQAITASDTQIELLDVSELPSPPNLMTIGTDEDAETVKYTAISGNILTVVRGFEGTAKAWPKNEIAARQFTNYDHDAFKGNIEELQSTKANILKSKIIYIMASDWVLDGMVYKNVVSVPEISATDFVFVVYPLYTNLDYQTRPEAESGNGTLTVYADEPINTFISATIYIQEAVWI